MNSPVSAIKNKTVIIADDDDVTRGMLRLVLGSIGMVVVEATRDGVQALAAFRKHRPQVVCLDIEMPEVDGLAVLNQIRAEDSNVVVLMVSGATTAENVRAALGARADGFIAKPFSSAKIAQEIERALTRRAAGPG